MDKETSRKLATTFRELINGLTTASRTQRELRRTALTAWRADRTNLQAERDFRGAHEERTGHLRYEARTLLLAWTYLRGLPRSRQERNAREPVSAWHLARALERLGAPVPAPGATEELRILRTALEAWLKDAPAAPVEHVAADAA